ncbi:MAG: hypothetical protein ACK559_02455, partial [bacterium]
MEVAQAQVFQDCALVVGRRDIQRQTIGRLPAHSAVKAHQFNRADVAVDRLAEEGRSRVGIEGRHDAVAV